MVPVKHDNNIIHLSASCFGRYNAFADKEQNVVGKRIAESRKSAGLTYEAFSELLKGYGVSVSLSSIFKWENGSTVPNAYQLMAISHAFEITDMYSRFASTYQPELNEVGLQKLAEYKKDLIATGLYSPFVKEKEYIEMPVSFLKTSAGRGQFLDSDLFEKESFLKSEVPEGADFGIWISGDSMEPVFHDGQIAWVQQCSELKVNEVGIFIYDDEGYIKVYNEREAPEEIADQFTDSFGKTYPQPVMCSYNVKYDPIPISPEASFQIIGRVLNSVQSNGQ